MRSTRAICFVVSSMLVAASGCHVVSGLSDFDLGAEGGGGGGGSGAAPSTSSGTGGEGQGGGGVELEVAGALLVDLVAADWTGAPSSWTNRAELGDFRPEAGPTVTAIEGLPAVCFDGIDDAFRGPSAPVSLSAASSRTIEVWVHNPELDEEESMVSWAPREEGAGTMVTFNFGDNGTYGAAAHWGNGFNLAWAPPPSPSVWHHLVYTYDGTWVRIYADGIPNVESELELDTRPDFPVILGAHLRTDDELQHAGGVGASLCLARVRIHAGALTALQVKTNHALGTDATR